jgi:hypothetical protein
MIGKFGWTKNIQSRGEIISLLLPNTPPPPRPCWKVYPANKVKKRKTLINTYATNGCDSARTTWAAAV